MNEFETLEQCKSMLEHESNLTLRKKLIAHRGWHRSRAAPRDRPLENTRQAFLDVVSLGMNFAECDVWNTSDGEVLLGHNWNMKAMMEDPTDPIAGEAIADLEWAEVRDIKLRGGATPVLLKTVLEDLHGTGTRLLVELKTLGAAAHTAEMLNHSPHLKGSIECVISFSLLTLETFHDALDAKDVKVTWVVDNPRIPYDPKGLDEGETTFDYCNETLEMFFTRLELIERMKRLKCGLHVQYTSGLTQEHICAWRSELSGLYREDGGDACAVDCKNFIGIWNDADLDPVFDRAATFAKWLPAVSGFNTDLPSVFFEGSGIAHPCFKP